MRRGGITEISVGADAISVIPPLLIAITLCPLYFFPFNQEATFIFSTKFSDKFSLLKSAQKLAMIENRHKYHSFIVTIVLVS